MTTTPDELVEQTAQPGDPLPPIPEAAYSEDATPLDPPPAADADEEEDDDTNDGDPLAIAQMLLASAADRLLAHKQGGTLNDKIALGHALSTYALAHAMRQQTAVMTNAHVIELSRMQRAKEQAGVTDSGIVVPR